MPDPALIEYRCPDCRRLAFRARRLSYERLEIKCTLCAAVVTPKPVGPQHATFRCPRCQTVERRERPPDTTNYCVACGVHMRLVTEPLQVESPAPVA